MQRGGPEAQWADQGGSGSLKCGIVSDLFCVLMSDVVCHVNSCVCIKLEESFIGWLAQVPRSVTMRLHLAEIFELGARMTDRDISRVSV